MPASKTLPSWTKMQLTRLSGNLQLGPKALRNPTTTKAHRSTNRTVKPMHFRISVMSSSFAMS
mgnify:CR=1 FL=1